VKTLVKVVLAVAVAFLLVRLVEGQFGRGGRERRNRVPEPSAVLRTVKSLKCSFSGGPALAISSIDVEEGSAEIAGGFRGGENVIVKLAGANLHFLDIALNGALGVITVFAKETPDGRLQAVYSRTSYVEPSAGGAGQPEVAQYQGYCEAGR
jgi:hypothetical protein